MTDDLFHTRETVGRVTSEQRSTMRLDRPVGAATRVIV